MSKTSNDNFFDTVPIFVEFGGVVDTSNYKPLPDDWVLATADIVSSTKAIAAGRYKAVNVAGASVISALLNAVGKKDYPFVFGGDGALVALPESVVEKARESLAAVQAWVADELKLELRAALVPMQDVRAMGLDVRVARFGASPDVSYAMFAGGGASWAEAQMKAGRYMIEPAPSGTRPDLTGLSCRWNPIDAHNGEIVSIIAVPGTTGPSPQFQTLVSDIVQVASEQSRGAHPLPAEPPIRFTLNGVDTEARATAPAGKRFTRKLAIIAQNVLIYGWTGSD